MQPKHMLILIGITAVCLHASAGETRNIRKSTSAKKAAKSKGTKDVKPDKAKKPKVSRVAKGKLYLRGIAGMRFVLPKMKKELEDIHGDAEYAGNVAAVVQKLGSDSKEQYVADAKERLSVVLDLKKLAMGRGRGVSLNDGDILYDTGGYRNRGDHYKLYFRMNRPAFVYIMQLDSTGKVYPLFPSATYGRGAGMANPLPGSRLCQIPPTPNDWIYLDKNRGDESIYVFFSKQRRPDMETMFQFFERRNPALSAQRSHTRGGVTARSAGVGALPRSVRPLAHRGPGGADYVPDQIHVGHMAKPDPLIGAKVFKPEHSELVITRWFVHR